MSKKKSPKSQTAGYFDAIVGEKRGRRDHPSAKPKTKLPACNACGCPEPNYLKNCPRCGSTKCDACDMGDDVECPACELDGGEDEQDSE